MDPRETNALLQESLFLTLTQVILPPLQALLMMAGNAQLCKLGSSRMLLSWPVYQSDRIPGVGEYDPERIGVCHIRTRSRQVEDGERGRRCIGMNRDEIFTAGLHCVQEMRRVVQTVGERRFSRVVLPRKFQELPGRQKCRKYCVVYDQRGNPIFTCLRTRIPRLQMPPCQRRRELPTCSALAGTRVQSAEKEWD